MKFFSQTIKITKINHFLQIAVKKKAIDICSGKNKNEYVAHKLQIYHSENQFPI
jgi:hypothetical protein